MRPELIRVEQSVFAWLGPAGLVVAELDDAGRPGPTRSLLSGCLRPGSFADRVSVIVDDERLTLDARGSVLARAPVVGPTIDAVLAWLAPEAAIVESVGRTCLRRIDVDVSIPITPAFFGLAHPPRLRVLGQRLVWAHSAVHVGVIDFDRASRPQPLGGVDRLGWAPTGPAIELWIDADQRQAAVLGDDGRVERFDLDTGRSTAIGWLPSGACAATAKLDQFVILEGHSASWIESGPTRETAHPDGWVPGPAATWLDADALVILDRDELVRVELPPHW